jgi:stage II sporulation protein GA (sporulation sigma-E factor processing peptidase)
LAGTQLFLTKGAVNPLLGVAVAISTLLLVAQLGWGVLQRRSWRQGQQIPIDITFGGLVTRITALLDTGNRLCDPISGAPAVVVEHKALARLFPPHLSQTLERMEAGDLQEVANLVGTTGWSSRFRIVPFTSIGAANGLMVGFRPDTITLWLGGKPHSLQGCVVALSPHNLDPARMYQALVGPELVENAVSSLN